MALIMLMSLVLDLNVEIARAADGQSRPDRLSYSQPHENAPHHTEPARLTLEKDVSEEIEVASHKRKTDMDNITTELSAGDAVPRRPLWALRDEDKRLSCPIEILASNLHSQGPPRV